MSDTTTSTVSDSTSYANNGTKKAANEPFQATGAVSYAQLFDGTGASDDYINIGSDSELDDISLLTIEAYVYPTQVTSGSANRLMDKNQKAVMFNYNIANFGLYQAFSGAAGRWNTYNSQVTANTTWQYFAISYNGTSDTIDPILYDGSTALSTGYMSEDAPAGTPSSDNTTNMLVGGLSAAGYSFKGYIDEFRVSNIIRSQGWLRASYLALTGQLLYYGDTQPTASVTNLPSSLAIDKDGSISTLAFGANVTSLGGSPLLDVSWEYGLTSAYGNVINAQSANFTPTSMNSTAYDAWWGGVSARISDNLTLGIIQTMDSNSGLGASGNQTTSVLRQTVSTDGGMTWGNNSIVVDKSATFGAFMPSPIFVPATNKIILFYSWYNGGSELHTIETTYNGTLPLVWSNDKIISTGKDYPLPSSSAGFVFSNGTPVSSALPPRLSAPAPAHE